MANLNVLPRELIEWKERIRERAKQVGLDFFEVIYEMVDYREINELASLGGFPQRYPHWRFGMEYDRLSKSYAYGMSKIYEMVINTDPCYAYLLSSNSLIEHKLVMAHVYGHSDFFKNNAYFAHTNRRMLDQMANHSSRVRKHQEAQGVDVVENFMDWCLSLENLIDTNLFAYQKKHDEEEKAAKAAPLEDPIHRFQGRSYMNKFLNPPEYIDEQKQRIQDSKTKTTRVPASPERDILGFLLKHAPLEPWQQECLQIVRDEAYYFAPQGQTKIMNEGWASFWHTHLMTKEGLMHDSEVVDFACVHSGTVAVHPGKLNPYKLGLELFRDIEERWNRGQFGKEWEDCESETERRLWDRGLGLGRQKVFEVRKLYNDITFIDEFLTEDFCRRQKMFAFAPNARTGQSEITSREFKKVKDTLLLQLTNFGQPLIEVVDGNFKNRGELLLVHRFDGRELKSDYATKTLRNLYNLWRRPVNVETRLNDTNVVMSFDGTQMETVPGKLS
ncbi:MAG TPA: SpoVR family protein [Bdellovibrionota bacterium]|jgi:stage V sporulation protein R|nr:SpoVR family protein [Bdellovibrionota bacterium]